MSEQGVAERTSAAAAESGSAPRKVVASVKEFVSAHGGSARAVLQPIGRAGVRITLVGSDGVLGDEVVADLPTARAVAAAAGVDVADGWDRELISSATPAPGHARKMAGWVANS
ncbi:hypothetical protein [Speluncibacter jeojiensis]|uniref:Uncharacterized protein n=1 Tax=Speluncibacter jeojiensis TaxID=2710754 RepID=A0A9X4M0U3_9ACTN|nr:hypothetical protein [Rhodococcus sp. D2-41]MDG3015928.1 hypothetical protein [Corynebacteriales bacterium D3-21]